EESSHDEAAELRTGSWAIDVKGGFRRSHEGDRQPQRAGAQGRPQASGRQGTEADRQPPRTGPSLDGRAIRAGTPGTASSPPRVASSWTVSKCAASTRRADRPRETRYLQCRAVTRKAQN